MNNGGLERVNKANLGNHGVHQKRYNTINTRERSGSPSKDAPTHYYQSDGSGRDGYILMDNGGSRPEYDRYHKTNEAIFLGSLRNERKSPIRDQRNRSPQE